MIGFIFVLCALLIATMLIFGAHYAKKNNIPIGNIKKIVIAVLSVVTLCRYLIGREAIFTLQGLNMYSPFGENIFQSIVAVLLVWFTFTSLLCIILGQFYDFKTLKNINKFFSAPVLILDLVLFKTYAIAISGVGVFQGFDIRAFLLAIEIGLALGLVGENILNDNELLPKKKDVLRMLSVLPFAILALMPTYALQALIGHLDNRVLVDDLTYEHRIVLYIGILLPVAIFHALKGKSHEVKRFAMIYMSLAWMWTYISGYTFASLANPLSWPLHLCNTAMFILPLCLIFKMDKLFYFCLFINVVGAFIAMVMPAVDVELNALATVRIRYWINHYQAFFSPMLFVALKIFEKPKLKQWAYSLIAFVFYFVFVLIINAWFSNYGEVNYFFLNNDFVVSKLGKWAEDTRNFVVSFEISGLKFVFYPVYQFLFFVVYILITVCIWFLYEIMFNLWESGDDRRMRAKEYMKLKKELLHFLGGRSINEPITGDDSPRLQLKGFYKRYGTNKDYSVRDANLDVHGGEIFGFLGPNGAGKSTIIKSIVGIQSITSGNIEICGYDVEKQSVQSKMNLGFVPDHYALYENLTGREYINYIADLYNVSQEDRDARIEKYLTNFQLHKSFDNQMKTYSHGMKQKIAIIATLIHNPKVWILDEPLTGLDPTSIYEVKECMKEHAAAGNIVFFSSHIIDVVEKICDRIAIIKKGKIRAVVSLKELEEKGIDLEQFYLDTIYGQEQVKTDEENNTVVGESAA